MSTDFYLGIAMPINLLLSMAVQSQSQEAVTQTMKPSKKKEVFTI